MPESPEVVETQWTYDVIAPTFARGNAGVAEGLPADLDRFTAWMAMEAWWPTSVVARGATLACCGSGGYG